ncbi:MAG: glycosyltransferase [Eubacterium sp.]|nr:glycosyltransferase [Eubacterium sp.]
MKLLMYRYGSICEPDLITGFQELGHTVLEITEEVTNKSLLPKDAVRIVSEYLFDHPVDFVFSVNFFPYVSEVCNIFKLPYICWSVDSPVLELYSTSISNEWNRVFLFDQTQFREIAPFNTKHVFHLPLAVNVQQKQTTIHCAPLETQHFFSADLSFVGSLYTEKCPYDNLKNPPAYLSGFLDGLMEAQMRIYGGYLVDELLTDEIVKEFRKYMPDFYTCPYDSYLTDKATLSQYYIGTKITAMERLQIMKFLSNRFSIDLYTASNTANFPLVHNRGLAKTMEEMPIIFHNSKINLNITSKSIRSGIPLRVFDIMGCGGFILTNYQSELTDYFSPNEDLVIYDNLEDLAFKCSYYLSHESERKEIAYHGLEKVRTYHTYPIRLEQMLRLAFS